MEQDIIAGAARILQLVLEEDAPEPFNTDENYERVFRRVIEIQAEQCNAILALYNSNLFRPAYAVLRGILEAMATILWVSTKIERYCDLFEEGKQPNTREILRRIGWEEEYERTFQYLSGFVHIDLKNADFYRDYRIEIDPSMPMSEIMPEGDYYLIGTDDEPVALAITPMSAETAKKLYGSYLAAKTFDIVAAGLQKLYGVEYYCKNWWSQETALLCMEIVQNRVDIQNRMLWSLQQKLI